MRRIVFLIHCGTIALISAPSFAGFASTVVSYTSGTGVGAEYQDPQAAVGMPSGDADPYVLTPFNSAWSGSRLVGIGPGGSLTLQLDHPAATGAGATIGVHAGVGMVDADWPNGFAGPVATLFTNPRVAEVFVSENNTDWFSLGVRTFDIPTNFYSQGITTPGQQMQPGTEEADFTKPFDGVLSDFNTLTWNQILTLLDDSAGGEWLDLTNVPFSGVNFIRFDVGAAQLMYVDAISVVPEPQCMPGVVFLMAAIMRRAR